MIQYTQCPVCHHESIELRLTAKDYTVSHQNFEIWECQHCTLRFTQNIPDQSEIAPYYKADDYISHTDTQKGIVNWLYHKVRLLTLKRKRKLIVNQTNISSGEILDIGCGTGAFLHVMQHAGWQVTGLEPDELARQKASSLHHIQAEIPEMLFQLQPGKYHAITMWHVLEHVHDLHAYIRRIKKILKDSGILLIAVPNYTSKDAILYKKFWAAYDVPRHLYHFTPQSIQYLLQQHGLTLKSVQPMWFDSFYISLLSEKYKNNGKGRFIKAIWNGLRSNVNTLFRPKQCSSLIYIVEKVKTSSESTQTA